MGVEQIRYKLWIGFKWLKPDQVVSININWGYRGA